MINFSLKEFVDENIQNFDPQNPQDIIKAEKLLKAESKLNNTFTINEIEEFLEYIKNQEQNFDNILNLSVIKSIYNDKYPENLKNKPDLRNISESEIEEFREVFIPFLKEFISVSVRNNQWQNLIYFQHFYAQFFSAESLDFYTVLLHDKNDLIIEGIIKNNNLTYLKKNYPFAVDKKFYYLQSLVDNFEFDRDILTINNVVAEHQKTSIDNKVVLGEILTAIFHFNASNDLTKNVIRKNQAIAEDWKNQKKGILSNLAYHIAAFFAKDQNPGLILFLSIVIFGVYILSFFFVISIDREALMFYGVVNLVAIYLAYRNFKYYFSLFDHKNLTDTLGKISATLLITMIVGFPLMLVVGFGLAYVFDSASEGKFPSGIIAPLIIIGVRIFLNKNK
ncbi:hypothetical protein GCM10023210_15970 [Chryseobacterium ginsengisoli]|uniref:Uncharacterized protein n=1 Tax=Chryseobacterium ginsengisoli TaxID=363853 RepID=A0ABP9M6U7_9FLAO